MPDFEQVSIVPEHEEQLGAELQEQNAEVVNNTQSFYERHADTEFTFMGHKATARKLGDLCPEDLTKHGDDALSRFTAKIAALDPNFEIPPEDKHWLEPASQKEAVEEKPQSPDKAVDDKGKNEAVKQEAKIVTEPINKELKTIAPEERQVVAQHVEDRTKHTAEVMSRSLIEHIQRDAEASLDLEPTVTEPRMHEKTADALFTPKPVSESAKKSVESILPQVKSLEKTQPIEVISVESQQPKKVVEYHDTPYSDVAELPPETREEYLSVINDVPDKVVVIAQYNPEDLDAMNPYADVEPETSEPQTIDVDRIEPIVESQSDGEQFEDEAGEISARLNAWTLEEILALTQSLHKENEVPDLTYAPRTEVVEKSLESAPDSPTEKIIHVIEASLVLQPEQVEKTEIFVATMPEQVQQQLSEFIAVDNTKETTPEQVEKVEHVKQLTVRIAEVADRLHILFMEDQLDSKEAVMIEQVLAAQYTELLEAIGVEIEADTIQNFIQLIRSEAYGYEAVNVAHNDYQKKWEMDHWTVAAQNVDDDENILRRWLKAGKAVVKNNVILAA